jgi:hypothetical protein
MKFEVGTNVKALDDSGNVRYTGKYLGHGVPSRSVKVTSPDRKHHAVQVNGTDVVYLDEYFWTIILA